MVLGWDSTGTPQLGGVVMFHDEGFASWGQRVQQVMGDRGLGGSLLCPPLKLAPCTWEGRGIKHHLKKVLTHRCEGNYG